MTKHSRAGMAALILIVCAAVFAASFFGAHIGAEDRGAEAAASTSAGAVVRPEPVTAADLDAEPINSRSISIPGYEEIRLQAQQTEQAIYLYNPAGNDCIFVISLFLDDIMLFETTPLDPGTEISNINLLQRLPAGSYEGATLKYSCFDCTDPVRQLNGADIKLKLEVLP